MKTIKITLVQKENELVFSTPVESQKIDEISGTLSARIIALMVKSRKFKMNLGFSFSRKFDVKIEIDGIEASGTETILNGLVKFGIAVQTNEASMDRFAEFIGELVNEILTGKNQLEGTFDELKEELGLIVE